MSSFLDCKMSDIEIAESSGEIDNKPTDGFNASPTFDSVAQALASCEQDQGDLRDIARVAPLLDYDWLLSRNSDLHRVVLEQGKRSQEQALVFNEAWQRLNRMEEAKDQIDWQRQTLWHDNCNLRSQLAQSQHALAVERFQHTGLHKALALRDDLIASIRQETFTQRDFSRLTAEQLSHVTRALAVAVRAPGSDEAHSILVSAYETQTRETERLRNEIGMLATKLEHAKEPQASQQQYIAPRPPSVVHPSKIGSPSRATGPATYYLAISPERQSLAENTNEDRPALRIQTHENNAVKVREVNGRKPSKRRQGRATT